jgi:hypothetical protein
MDEAKCFQCGFRHQVEVGVVLDDQRGRGYRFMCSCGDKGAPVFSVKAAQLDGAHHLKMVTDHG